MPYEEGSYLKELKEEHQKGDHKHHPDDNCPTCRREADEKDAREQGFESLEAYESFAADQCNRPDPELEAEIDKVFMTDHRNGKHTKYPNRDCLTCIKQHGINNI